MYKKIHDYLKQPNQACSTLLKNSALVKELEEYVQSLLPPELKEHCKVCHLNAGKLYLVTYSGSVLTRLRYETPTLLSELRKNPKLAHLAGIVCKVQPDLAIPTPEKLPALPEPKKPIQDAFSLMKKILAKTP